MEIDSPRAVRSQVGIPTISLRTLDVSRAGTTDRDFGGLVLLVAPCNVSIVAS